MNILVTGGTAFVSRRTAEYFIAAGASVYVLNRGSAPQPDGAVHIRSDRRSIGGALRGLALDAVLDITAYGAEDVTALVGALDGHPRYILLSSSAVYPETLALPFRETDPCGENIHWGGYGTGKIAAEQALLGLIPDAYIVRPPYLCGAMNNLYREAFIFDCAESGRRIYLPGDGGLRLQFFDAGDLCRFFELILLWRPEPRIFNVGNADTVSAKEWCSMCCSVLGREPEFVFVDRERADARDYFPFRDYEYRLDVSRQLGLMPDTAALADSLRGSWEYYRGHRGLVRRKPYIDYIDSVLA